MIKRASKITNISSPDEEGGKAVEFGQEAKRRLASLAANAIASLRFSAKQREQRETVPQSRRAEFCVSVAVISDNSLANLLSRQ